MKQYIIVFLIIVSCVQKSSIVKIISEPKESLPSLNLSKSQLLGQINYKNDSLFVLVNKNLANKEIYLNRVAYDSFVEMYKQAKKDSIYLKILSGLTPDLIKNSFQKLIALVGDKPLTCIE